MMRIERKPPICDLCPQMKWPRFLSTNTLTLKPSREKTVLIGGHFPPEVQRQLRMIAAEEGTTNQALLAEALNLLFRKKGKDAIPL